MNNLAQLTLELFMNKNAYNRYMEKTDPNKYDENQKYISQMQKNKGRILDITRRFIDNPDLQITVEMNEMFSDYCKTCLKYLELKDLENSCQSKNDEETLFDFSTDDFEVSSTKADADSEILSAYYK